MQIDNKAPCLKAIAVARIQDCTATGGQDDVIQGCHPINGFHFTTPESGLTLDLENNGNTHPGTRFYVLIRVMEFLAKATRQRARNGCFARAWHSDKKDIG